MDSTDNNKNEQQNRIYIKRKTQKLLLMSAAFAFLLLVMVIILIVLMNRNNQGNEPETPVFENSSPIQEEINELDWIISMPLTINEYSRPGDKIRKVNGIVIHNTGNPGTTAVQNRNYFEKLATTGEASVSSNFIVCLDGTIIQCIPVDEIAYASNFRNNDTLSIEVCHPDDTGQFNSITYASVVRLAAWLCNKYNLTIDEIYRHYDVNEKECPKYYVDNEDAWIKLKNDIINEMANSKQYPITVTDQAGRKVVIDKEPERLVSGYYISTTTIIAIGKADTLVGIEAGAEKRPIYKLARPDLLELPNVGTAKDFNIEACLALEPDLVILPIRLRDIADILSDMNIQVILVNPESTDEIRDMFQILGTATGAEERANYLLAWWKTNMPEANAVSTTVTDKTTVYMTGTGTYLSTAPEGMFQSSLITLAGAINAAGGLDGESRQQISYEQMLVMNPQVIIIPPEASFDINDITDDPQLRDIDAVLNNRVYRMPDAFEAWDSPIPSSILGMWWLRSILYDDFPMDDTRQLAREFYSKFYDIEIDSTIIK